MLNIFKFFTSLWNKLQWVINFVYTYLSPIYSELVKVIKAVQESNFEDEAARKAVFQKMTDFIQARGLKISDSLLNCMIEMVYQLVRAKKE